MGDFEENSFQVKTEAAITGSNKVSINFLSGSGEKYGWVRTGTSRMEMGSGCTEEATVTHEGANRGGSWTFLKTSKKMTVWFDGDIVTTYEYNSGCSLSSTAYGIRFKDSGSRADTASVAYRFAGKHYYKLQDVG